MIQHYEDVLPYEDFSIRLTNADLPRLRELLRSVTDEQYRRLLENLLRYHKAFSWNAKAGGQASCQQSRSLCSCTAGVGSGVEACSKCASFWAAGRRGQDAHGNLADSCRHLNIPYCRYGASI